MSIREYRSISVSFDMAEVSGAMKSQLEMGVETQPYLLPCGQTMLGAQVSPCPHITYDVVGPG